MQRWLVVAVSCLATACFEETDPVGGSNSGSPGSTSDASADGSTASSGVSPTSDASASATDATMSADASSGADATDTGEDTTGSATCGPGEACLPSSPMPPWQGPVALLRAPANAPPLTCPPEFMDGGGSFADVDPGTVSCTCSCSGGILPCTYEVSVHDTAICDSQIPQTAVVGAGDCLDANLFVDPPGSVSFRVNDDTASCGEANVSKTASPVTYATQFRTCIPSPVGPCATGECFPELAQMPSVGGLCVFQDGDVPCDPASAFTDRHLTHMSTNDMRMCDAGDCECELIDAQCNASLESFNMLGCPGGAGSNTAKGDCSGATATTSVRVVDAPAVVCTPPTDNVPPVGELALEGTRTYCCRASP